MEIIDAFNQTTNTAFSLVSFQKLAYLLAALMCIIALAFLSQNKTAVLGNKIGAFGMGLAVIFTIISAVRQASLQDKVISQIAVLSGQKNGTTNNMLVTIVLIVLAMGIGAVIGLTRAKKIAMTSMPELVAILHSFVGLAAVLVGYNTFITIQYNSMGSAEAYFHLGEIAIGVFIGAVTFTGSIIAFLKLSGKIKGAPLMLPHRNLINLIALLASLFLTVAFILTSPKLTEPTPEKIRRSLAYALIGKVSDPLFTSSPWQWVALILITIIALALGLHLVAAIGGGDMPVVVSMLNSYSGWAAAAAGFMLGNNMLIIAGALVGSSGAYLSYVMCKAMNRSFISVILGGFGEGTNKASAGSNPEEQGEYTEISASEVASELLGASSVIIAPGYGMAQAQAQAAVSQLSKLLTDRGINVRFAIHPVAGRMPGHMNVLLSEARVPYDAMLEMDEINDDFPDTDVVLVIGANDTVNPDAEKEEGPIAGMPVLEVWKAGRVVVFKRSMNPGYAGVQNPLFFRENSRMLFGDAKASVEEIIKNI